MKKLFLILFCCLLSIAASSQFESTYAPAPIQDTIPADIFRALKSKLELSKSKITGVEGKAATYAKDLYNQRADIVEKNFNDDYFIVDNEITPYLQSVLRNIYEANPSLPRETSVYAFRSEVVNAMSYGEGTIAFTLGLLARMENEAQIAYVLCHELAHYHARHSDITVVELARLNYDKDIKKKVKSIEKSEYGKYTKYSALMGSLGLSINKHSRYKEFEADSLALQLYLKTTYDLHAPVRVLEILDHAEESIHQENIDFKKFFDFASYPLKETWLSYQPANTWYASSANKADSLRTHPSCLKRIAAIQRQLKLFNPAERKHQDTNDKINYIRTRSYFEIVVSNYHFEEFGSALFNSMILAQRYPDNVYLHSIISQCLYQLYLNQKNHTLGRVLLLPDPRLEENYNRFLTFIHNLRLMELASISYHYAMTKKDLYKESEELLYACWLNSHSEISQIAPEKIKTEYQLAFPSGNYLSKMQK